LRFFGRAENPKSEIRSDMTTGWPRQPSRNVIPSERSERGIWAGGTSKLKPQNSKLARAGGWEFRIPNS
jgi:hypothetical protein